MSQPGERLADQAVARPDVEHQITVANTGAVNQSIDRALIDEEVLAEHPAPNGSVWHAPEAIRERGAPVLSNEPSWPGVTPLRRENLGS